MGRVELGSGGGLLGLGLVLVGMTTSISNVSASMDSSLQSTFSGI